MQARLTTDQAFGLLHAAFEAAQLEKFRPMAVVVVDVAGHVLVSGRQDGASALRLDIALGKAAASIGMGASSRILAKRAAEMPVFYGSIASVAQQKFVPQTGAVLVISAGGDLLGAMGASGGTGDEDEKICMTALAATGFTAG